ncbi:unnamed protein product [Cyprideis torosa]|uniref:Uncharacterized protein n=1 Tax=Cyprideis torosa TaxID=163714 RepID=A0A7R8W3U5_9CRUS|nr:unnamed protein product [Cyprideis torosa]CAG0883403.1 unnamed protein product [Cyprideis torosa]
MEPWIPQHVEGTPPFVSQQVHNEFHVSKDVPAPPKEEDSGPEADDMPYRWVSGPDEDDIPYRWVSEPEADDPYRWVSGPEADDPYRWVSGPEADDPYRWVSGREADDTDGMHLWVSGPEADDPYSWASGPEADDAYSWASGPEADDQYRWVSGPEADDPYRWFSGREADDILYRWYFQKRSVACAMFPSVGRSLGIDRISLEEFRGLVLHSETQDATFLLAHFISYALSQNKGDWKVVYISFSNQWDMIDMAALKCGPAFRFRPAVKDGKLIPLNGLSDGFVVESGKLSVEPLERLVKTTEKLLLVLESPTTLLDFGLLTQILFRIGGSNSCNMSSRRATHSGSWYTDNTSELDRQLRQWLDRVDVVHGPAKAVIAPHAGYQYSGPTAAFAYNQINPAAVKRIFILGPSHHVRLSGCAVSACQKYQTPLYSLLVDTGVNEELLATGHFERMSLPTDEDEHSIEMHLPYIAKIMEYYSNQFTIVPILVGSLTPEKEALYGRILAPYLMDPETVFVLSSDFCHWGQRFRYTYYDKGVGGEIHACIRRVDQQGMTLIERLDAPGFTEYLKKTGNTICGRHPIGVFLYCMEHLFSIGSLSPSRAHFKFLKYAQSSRCVSHMRMNIWDRLTALIIILLIPSCLLSIWLFPFEFFCGGLVGGVALFIVCNFLPPPRTDSVKRLYDILVLLWLCFCVLLAGEFLPGFILSILIPSFALLCFSYFCALITVMGAADWRWGQGFAVSDLTGAIKTTCPTIFKTLCDFFNVRSHSKKQRWERGYSILEFSAQSSSMRMTDSDKLPGIIIVFLIASGVLVFILLFIFAKRQIRRFTLRSRKGPHVPVGFGASSALRREINRRLDRVAEIKCEPRLLLEGNGITEDSDSVYWRMKTVDAVKDLGERHLKDLGERRLKDLCEGNLKDLGERRLKDLCEGNLKDLGERHLKDLGESHLKDLCESHLKDLSERHLKDLGERRLKDLGERHLKDLGERRLKDLGESHLKDLSERHLKDLYERHLKDLGERHLKDLGERHLKDLGERHLKDFAERRLKDLGEGNLKDLGERHLKDLGESHLKDLSESHLKDLSERHLKDLYERHLKDLGERHLKDLGERHLKDLSESHLKDLYDRYLKDLCERHLKDLSESYLKDLEDPEPNLQNSVLIPDVVSESELGLHHNVPKRYPGDSLRAYLLSLEKGPLAKAQTDAVKQYCDLYEHARFHPAPYGKTEHLQFQETHEDILKSIWNTESCTVSDINRKTVVSHSSATPRQRPLPGASGGGVAFRSLSSSRDPAAQALLAEDTTHPNGQL